MRLRLWIAAGLAMALASCTGGPGGPRREPPGFERDGPGGPRPPRAQLFISPSGEPFRASAGQVYPSAQWFLIADADKDGRLTRAEFLADAERWFRSLDTDENGEVSMPEVTRWEEDLVPEVTRPTFAGGAGGGPGGRRGGPDTRRSGAAAYSLINEPHPIRGADEDFSTGVSLAEWRRASSRRFALLDRDGDGAILAVDLGQTPSQGPLGKGGALETGEPRQGGGGGRPPPRR